MSKSFCHVNVKPFRDMKRSQTPDVTALTKVYKTKKLPPGKQLQFRNIFLQSMIVLHGNQLFCSNFLFCRFGLLFGPLK